MTERPARLLCVWKVPGLNIDTETHCPYVFVTRHLLWFNRCYGPGKRNRQSDWLWAGLKSIILLAPLQEPLLSTQSPVNYVQRFTLSVKSIVYRSSHTRAEFKYTWSFTSAPLILLQGALLRHWENFITFVSVKQTRVLWYLHCETTVVFENLLILHFHLRIIWNAVHFVAEVQLHASLRAFKLCFIILKSAQTMNWIMSHGKFYY